MSDIMTEDRHDLSVDWYNDTGDSSDHDNQFPNCLCLNPLANAVNVMLDEQRHIMEVGFDNEV